MAYHLNLIARYKTTIYSTKTKSMAMWRKHIQRLKIVINDSIIEQVRDFRFLGYCISEYKSDLEDILQTYNKINGAIRRHFGKQRNKVKNSLFFFFNLSPKIRNRAAPDSSCYLSAPLTSAFSHYPYQKDERAKPVHLPTRLR
jgi:hypothetical protein